MAAQGRTPKRTSQFKADLRRAATHRKCDLEALRAAMTNLVAGNALDPSLLDHALSGRYPRRNGYTDCRECHTSNDWLLVYRIDGDEIVFIRTGTHSDLF